MKGNVILLEMKRGRREEILKDKKKFIFANSYIKMKPFTPSWRNLQD